MHVCRDPFDLEKEVWGGEHHTKVKLGSSRFILENLGSVLLCFSCYAVNSKTIDFETVSKILEIRSTFSKHFPAMKFWIREWNCIPNAVWSTLAPSIRSSSPSANNKRGWGSTGWTPCWEVWLHLSECTRCSYWCFPLISTTLAFPVLPPRQPDVKLKSDLFESFQAFFMYNKK